MKTTDIMKRLRGPKGTEVNIKVLRNKNPELIEFKIIRGKIPVTSLDAAYMADKQTRLHQTEPFCRLISR